MKAQVVTLAVAIGALCAAQPAGKQGKTTAKPAPKAAPVSAVQAQSTSSLNYGGKPGEEKLEIINATYEVTAAFIPGRPQQERLVLRKASRLQQIAGEMDIEASITLEAWPLTSDLKAKPIYSLTATGTEGHTLDGTLFVVNRGIEEIEWWTVYKLGTGQKLFDTYVPALGFSISRDSLTQRYIGFEVPEDNTKDPRLKNPQVVGVVTYASAEKVIREALLTCDDPKQAVILRSFADATRTMRLLDQPALGVHLTITNTYPSKPVPVAIEIPVSGDTLDLAHAQLPPHLHLTAWRR